MEPSSQSGPQPEPLAAKPQPQPEISEGAARRGPVRGAPPPSSRRNAILFGALLIGAVVIGGFGTGLLKLPATGPATAPVAATSQTQSGPIDEQDKVHWIGVQIQNVTADAAKSIGSNRADGVLVRSVRPGSPANQAGILADDIIIAADGVPLKQTNDLVSKIHFTTAGDQVTLTLERKGAVQSVAVRVALEKRCSQPGNPICSF
jgi:hypothetical protein